MKKNEGHNNSGSTSDSPITKLDLIPEIEDPKLSLDCYIQRSESIQSVDSVNIDSPNSPMNPKELEELDRQIEDVLGPGKLKKIKSFNLEEDPRASPPKLDLSSANFLKKGNIGLSDFLQEEPRISPCTLNSSSNSTSKKDDIGLSIFLEEEPRISPCTLSSSSNSALKQDNINEKSSISPLSSKTHTQNI